MSTTPKTQGERIKGLLATRVPRNRSLNLSWSDNEANQVLIDELIPGLGVNLRKPASDNTTTERGKVRSRLFHVSGRQNVGVEIRDIETPGMRTRLLFLAKFGRDIIPPELTPRTRKA
ncbi:hypothetical protein A3K55_00830 [Candidatus Shapirobacteria bacterium RBG_13_44_7]|uniref:Uncharacterized protein n=1 Tax=Candidatus Shapirobacteria bacterium RBG_13_44_7 TaxID=1802149 RepID=A0A1F7SKJ3_9BACT|nr:MAG: hypothetical protein A3K55_00830 [Candidatus Shapirobacteria bacterium RBG_13_44_7]